MSHLLTKDLTRRLAFVRYLYGVGVDQSHKPEPFAAVAVLTFHDACEMFLQIAAEHNRITTKRRSPDFMDYWQLFDEQTKLQITSKPSMDRLNRARVNLKHGGVLPAHDEIGGFRAAVATFLEENAPLLLGVSFDDVSLTSLIKSDDVRAPLKRAEAAFSSGDLKSALEAVAPAFVVTLRRFESRPRASTRAAGPYSLRDAAMGSFFGRLNRLEFGDELYDTLAHVVDVFSDAITVVAYNLDFDSYLVFKTHAPIVHEFAGGGMQVEWTMRSEPKDPEVVRRCINFVIDTAIRLEARE